MPLPARRIATAVESWFETHQRFLPWRATYDPYLVWVSEVMLQQTRMEVVLRHYGSFIERFPSLTALASAAERDVLAAWSGLGYYRRARMLHAAARDVADRFAGAIPRDVKTLTSIRGIGRYTAGAISSIAFEERAAIVDGNVARIVARIAGIAEPTGSPRLMRAAWSVAEELVKRCAKPRVFNQGLMEIGALVCTPRNPKCDACPIRKQCGAYASGRPSAFPVPKEKKSTTRMVVSLYLIDDGKGRILMRRESGALMTAMFHLPHGTTSLLTGQPLRVRDENLVGTFRHTITTRNVEFHVHRATLQLRVAEGDEYAWIDPDDLKNVPHPSYVTKALRLARRNSLSR
ncbi:MAG TPA: A/G-specific adenine glycosylase [Thermoanaerobaculia bacterium]